ncbi:hypothetical protein SAMN06265361_103454 [Laceyella tengchongensis]|uniref:Uncharacterized protein n=1 Tax=Laceyella tengchongensis TaxID=574699 RepID=A0AA46AFP7_9BACL|nr:hypothetical protein SAMN06265361_103454 [Laceyella tengchongensis]
MPRCPACGEKENIEETHSGNYGFKEFGETFDKNGNPYKH